MDQPRTKALLTLAVLVLVSEGQVRGWAQLLALPGPVLCIAHTLLAVVEAQDERPPHTAFLEAYSRCCQCPAGHSLSLAKSAGR